MASNGTSLALFLLNILFFTQVAACGDSPCQQPKYKPTPYPGTGGTSGWGWVPSGYCPRDALKLGVCANVLSALLNVVIGTPPKEPCCTLIQGLADLEAAACLCIAIKANILGINLNVPLSLSLLLNVCGYDVPKGFLC